MGKPKVAVVTGGAQGIGKSICDDFFTHGVSVCTIDLLENDYFIGDIADEQVLRAFASKVIAEHGAIDFLINNACLSRGGLNTCSYEEFNYVLRVGITAPFLLTQLFMEHFNTPASLTISFLGKVSKFRASPKTVKVMEATIKTDKKLAKNSKNEPIHPA